jgi:hypothetical protein
MVKAERELKEWSENQWGNYESKIKERTSPLNHIGLNIH